jgi:hypothetical protein
MKKSIFFIYIFICISFAQEPISKTHFCFGYTPIFGVELGALSENRISRIPQLNFTNKITLGYMIPITSNIYSHTITGSCQVGFKFNLLKGKLNPGAGLTFNAFMPYNQITEQMESLFVAYGYYISLSTKTHGIEPAIMLSIIKPNDTYEYDTSIGLITLMISKQF